ncbi:hypothetical protein [Micromonospora sp. DT47]|uniref:hypothetical protein n=1 Tax=Micromonospora sp. DT47 TaxID=3393431 RepID=UPI003CF5C846
MWPWRRRRLAQEPAAPAWTPTHQEWSAVAPIQRTLADTPLVNPVQRFSAALAAWQDPRFLAPLEHVIAPDEPSGVIGLTGGPSTYARAEATYLPLAEALRQPARPRPTASPAQWLSSAVQRLVGPPAPPARASLPVTAPVSADGRDAETPSAPAASSTSGPGPARALDGLPVAAPAVPASVQRLSDPDAPGAASSVSPSADPPDLVETADGSPGEEQALSPEPTSAGSAPTLGSAHEHHDASAPAAGPPASLPSTPGAPHPITAVEQATNVGDSSAVGVQRQVRTAAHPPLTTTTALGADTQRASATGVQRYAGREVPQPSMRDQGSHPSHLPRVDVPRRADTETMAPQPMTSTGGGPDLGGPPATGVQRHPVAATAPLVSAPRRLGLGAPITPDLDRPGTVADPPSAPGPARGRPADAGDPGVPSLGAPAPAASAGGQSLPVQPYILPVQRNVEPTQVPERSLVEAPPAASGVTDLPMVRLARSEPYRQPLAVVRLIGERPAVTSGLGRPAGPSYSGPDRAAPRTPVFRLVDEGIDASAASLARPHPLATTDSAPPPAIVAPATGRTGQPLPPPISPPGPSPVPVQRQDMPAVAAVPEIAPPAELAPPTTPSAVDEAVAAAAGAVPQAMGAVASQAAIGAEPEELLAKLFDPMLRRLKAELRIDRDRRGWLTDLPH